MRKNRILLPLILTLALLAVVLAAFNGAPAQAQNTAQATAAPTATPPANPTAPTPAPGSGVQKFDGIAAPTGNKLLYLVLNLYPDGKAELITDALTDAPPVTQTGTWTRDGSTLSLSLTGEGTRTLDKPITIVFSEENDKLAATEFDKAIYGADGLRFQLLDDMDQKVSEAPDAFLSLNLAAGFPLDPFLVSVNGGGNVDASTLSEACHGYIDGNPTIQVEWTGTADLVRAFTYSDADPVLVVQTPDGKFVCNDDAGALAIDAQVEISKPAEGTYRLWVGSAQPHQLLPTVLVLTARSDVTLANFDLGNLVKRPPVPAEGAAVPEEKQPNVVTDAIARFKGAVGGALVATPLKQQINSAGTLGAFDIDFGDAVCNGFISETPDYVFDVSSALDRFSVLFESKQDSTLLVVGPDGTVLCNDDALGGENVNPVVSIEKPTEGRYGVFVGRLDTETPATGTLTITTDPQVTPAVLPPSQ